jgi:hypothetical protein
MIGENVKWSALVVAIKPRRRTIPAMVAPVGVSTWAPDLPELSATGWHKRHPAS